MTNLIQENQKFFSGEKSDIINLTDGLLKKSELDTLSSNANKPTLAKAECLKALENIGGKNFIQKLSDFKTAPGNLWDKYNGCNLNNEDIAVFQFIHNLKNPDKKIDIDGQLGPKTYTALMGYKYNEKYDKSITLGILKNKFPKFDNNFLTARSSAIADRQNPFQHNGQSFYRRYDTLISCTASKEKYEKTQEAKDMKEYKEQLSPTKPEVVQIVDRVQDPLLNTAIHNTAIDLGISENLVNSLVAKIIKLRKVAEIDPAKAAELFVKIANEDSDLFGRIMEKMGSAMGLVPILAFLKNPIFQKTLRGFGLVGSVFQWNNLIGAWNKDPDAGFGEKMKELGIAGFDIAKYMVPFAGNLFDYQDGNECRKKGEKGRAAINYATGTLGMVLDVVSLTGVGAAPSQGVKLGLKGGVKAALKIKNISKAGGLLLDAGKAVKGKLDDGAKRLAKLATDPTAQKKFLQNNAGKLDTALGALEKITKFDSSNVLLKAVTSVPRYLIKETIDGLLRSLSFGFAGIKGFDKVKDLGSFRVWLKSYRTPKTKYSGSEKWGNDIEIEKNKSDTKSDIERQFNDYQSTPEQKQLANHNKWWEQQSQYELEILHAQQLMSDHIHLLTPEMKILHTAGDVVNLSPNDIKRIQRQIGVKDDGIWGPQSLNALSTHFDNKLSSLQLSKQSESSLGGILDVKAIDNVILSKGHVVVIDGKKYTYNGIKNNEAVFVPKGHTGEIVIVKDAHDLLGDRFNLEPGTKTTNNGRKEKLQKLLSTVDAKRDVSQSFVTPNNLHLKQDDGSEKIIPLKKNHKVSQEPQQIPFPSYEQQFDKVAQGIADNIFGDMPSTKTDAVSRVEQFGIWLGKTTVGPTMKFYNDAMQWLKNIQLKFPDLNLGKKIDEIKKSIRESALQKRISVIDLYYSIGQEISIPRSDGSTSKGRVESFDSKTGKYKVVREENGRLYSKETNQTELDKVNVLQVDLDIPKIDQVKSKNYDKYQLVKNIFENIKNNEVCKVGFDGHEVSKKKIIDGFLEARFIPNNKVDLGGGNMLFVTNQLECKGTRFIVGYTQQGDVRLFYRSGSEAEWRSTPGLRRGDGKFSKAEYIENSSYETTTKCDARIGMTFDSYVLENVDINPLDKSGEIMEKMGFDKVEFNLPSMQKEISIQSMFAEFSDAVHFYQGKTVQIVQDGYKNLQIPGLDMNSMRLDPNKGYSFTHDYLGKIQVDVVKMTWKGKEIDIHFANATDGKVFITNMVYSDAKINSFGVYNKQINAGPLTAKPIDYATEGAWQVPSDANFQRYGSYMDIRDLYQDMPLIQEYRKNKSSLNKSKGSKSEIAKADIVENVKNKPDIKEEDIYEIKPEDIITYKDHNFDQVPKVNIKSETLDLPMEGVRHNIEYDITIGKQNFTLRQEGNNCILTQNGKSGLMGKLQLSKGEYYEIGRKHNPGGVFDVSDPQISESHCTIMIEKDGSIMIYDHSTNGTTIERRKTAILIAAEPGLGDDIIDINDIDDNLNQQAIIVAANNDVDNNNYDVDDNDILDYDYNFFE